MTGFLYIAALAFSALSVSALGAAFSVAGLMRLFAGAPFAVAAMASALELSKLVAAAFVHRAWPRLNFVYKTYLLGAIVVLSCITSLGIFGFLSDAYQASSKDLTADNIRIEALKADQTRTTDEIARINRGVDEIPVDRISRKLRARKEAEPMIQELTRKSNQIAKELEEINLRTVDTKAKIGPLIYVARVFHQDADTIVKWLILVFVGVFDPLAICLVIGTSEALKLKSEGFFEAKAYVAVQHESSYAAHITAEEAHAPSVVVPERHAMAEGHAPSAKPSVDPVAASARSEDSVRMRFVDEPGSKKAG